MHTVDTAPRVQIIGTMRVQAASMGSRGIDGICKVIEVTALAESCHVIWHGSQEGSQLRLGHVGSTWTNLGTT